MKNKKQDFDNFDEFADDYRGIHNNVLQISGADTEYFNEQKVKEVKAHESMLDDLDILDLGCGDGTTINYFSKHFTLSRLEGIDISTASISIAKTKNIKNSEFKAYNGSNIPFEDATFDIVFSAVVFHHIDFKLHSDLIQEIKRVLKPGGRFYIFEHNPHNPITRKIVNDCEFDKDAVLLKPSYAKQIIKANGLKIKELSYILFFPRFNWTSKFLFLEKFLKKVPLGGQYYVKAIKNDK